MYPNIFSVASVSCPTDICFFSRGHRVLDAVLVLFMRGVFRRLGVVKRGSVESDVSADGLIGVVGLVGGDENIVRRWTSIYT